MKFAVIFFIIAVSFSQKGEAEEFKIDKAALPSVAEAENALLVKMPSVADVPFNPVLIETFRDELEAFHVNEIKRFALLMERRCKTLIVFDGKIRSNLIPQKKYSWDYYQETIKPYLTEELEKCSVTSSTSGHAAVLNKAISRYRSYMKAYKKMSRLCRKSSDCSVTNA